MVIFAFFEGSIQLVPDGTILVHISLVLLMVAVLNRTLFGPVNRVLSERHRKGFETVNKSAEIEKRVEDQERRYRDALRSARTAGYRLMQERRSLDLKDRERQLASLRHELEERIFRERKSIEKQANDAKDGIDGLTLGTMIRDRVLKPVRDRGSVN
jgi:F0F1-type ATP synthase membrane subunit b/b'